MTKFMPKNTKAFGIVAIVFAVILVLGIILAAAVDIPFVAVAMIGLMGTIIGAVMYFAKSSNGLIIGPDEMRLPRESRKNGREVDGRISVLFSEIDLFRMAEGGGFFSNGVKYEIFMKNGTQITFKLKGFTVEEEETIYKAIQDRIK